MLSVFHSFKSAALSFSAHCSQLAQRTPGDLHIETVANANCHFAQGVDVATGDKWHAESGHAARFRPADSKVCLHRRHGQTSRTKGPVNCTILARSGQTKPLPRNRPARCLRSYMPPTHGHAAWLYVRCALLFHRSVQSPGLFAVSRRSAFRSPSAPALARRASYIIRARGNGIRLSPAGLKGILSKATLLYLRKMLTNILCHPQFSFLPILAACLLSMCALPYLPPPMADPQPSPPPPRFKPFQLVSY